MKIKKKGDIVSVIVGSLIVIITVLILTYVFDVKSTGEISLVIVILSYTSIIVSDIMRGRW